MIVLKKQFFLTIIFIFIIYNYSLASEKMFKVIAIEPNTNIINNTNKQIFIYFNSDIHLDINEDLLSDYIIIEGCDNTEDIKFYRLDRNCIVIENKWTGKDSIKLIIKKNIYNIENISLQEDFIHVFQIKNIKENKELIQETKDLKQQYDHYKYGNKQQKDAYDALNYFQNYLEKDEQLKQIKKNPFSCSISFSEIFNKDIKKLPKNQKNFKLNQTVYIYIELINLQNLYDPPWNIQFASKYSSTNQIEYYSDLYKIDKDGKHNIVYIPYYGDNRSGKITIIVYVNGRKVKTDYFNIK